MQKKNLKFSDRILLLAGLLLLTALLWFSISVLQGWRSGQKECQALVSLDPDQIQAQLLSDLGKFPGLQSATPLMELGVQLKVDGCTMDAKFTGIELDLLSMRVQATEDTMLGAEPVLLLGADSLKEMTDRNGQALSGKRQQEILEQFADLNWQYRMVDSEADSSAQNVKVTTSWNPCRVAAVLREPADRIFLPLSQAESLLSAGKQTVTGQGVTGLLLRVKGEENLQRILGALQKGSG